MDAKSDAEMQFKITVELTEVEARALHAITTYGSKSFLEVFYKSLGQSSLKPHENGIVTLFNTAQKKLPVHFARIEKTKKAFNER